MSSIKSKVKKVKVVKKKIENEKEEFVNKEIPSTYYLAIDVGRINLGYAIYDGENIGFNVLNVEKQINEKTKMEFGEKTSKIEVLNKWVNHLCKQYNFTKVYIEQQVINNVGAMVIQSILETLFYIKGIPCHEFAATNKFKYLNPQYDTKKKEHKKISIEYAKNILKHHNIDLVDFNKFPKKDDISDAICMTFMTFREDRNEINLIKEYLQ